MLTGPSFTKFEGVRSSNGNVRLEISKESQKFIKNCDSVVQRQIEVLVKIRDAAEGICEGLQKASDQALIASKCFIEMNHLMKSFN